MVAASAPALATALAIVRYLQQGSGNVYTDTSHGYYLPDPDLGWRFVEEGPIWLGFDAVGALMAVAVVVFVLGRWLSRTGAPSQGATIGLWVVGVLPLVVPIAALASGMPPEGARDDRPEATVEAPTDGIQASLPGPAAGTFAVADDPQLATIVATVSAGGETFEARFGGLKGTWTGDPRDLGQPMSATITADPRTVDTGVELRSKHAGEYLEVESHDTLTLTLTGMDATAAGDDGAVTFSGAGSLTFIGDTLDLPLTGTARTLDQDACKRLGLEASAALKITASLTLAIADTKLSAHATDFSSDQIPIRVELVLVPTPQ